MARPKLHVGDLHAMDRQLLDRAMAIIIVTDSTKIVGFVSETRKLNGDIHGIAADQRNAEGRNRSMQLSPTAANEHSHPPRNFCGGRAFERATSESSRTVSVGGRAFVIAARRQRMMSHHLKMRADPFGTVASRIGEISARNLP